MIYLEILSVHAPAFQAITDQYAIHANGSPSSGFSLFFEIHNAIELFKDKSRKFSLLNLK